MNEWKGKKQREGIRVEEKENRERMDEWKGKKSTKKALYEREKQRREREMEADE